MSFAATAGQELKVLWFGGKAPLVLTVFAFVAGVLSFLFATNAELSLLPPLETMNLLAQTTLAFGVLTCLILGADTISGERDRGSLEALLLTPAPRRGIILGKYVAALSPWPAIVLIATPFLWQLAPTTAVFLDLYTWMLLLGTLLVFGFTALAVWVSMRSASNKTSLTVSLTLFLAALIPTQLPGTAQTGGLGVVIKKVNPAESVVHLLEKLTINNNTPDMVWDFFLSPIALAVLGIALIAWRRNPHLKLGGDA